jgi:hypothetical protein
MPAKLGKTPVLVAYKVCPVPRTEVRTAQVFRLSWNGRGFRKDGFKERSRARVRLGTGEKQTGKECCQDLVCNLHRVSDISVLKYGFQQEP